MRLNFYYEGSDPFLMLLLVFSVLRQFRFSRKWLTCVFLKGNTLYNFTYSDPTLNSSRIQCVIYHVACICLLRSKVVGGRKFSHISDISCQYNSLRNNFRRTRKWPNSEFGFNTTFKKITLFTISKIFTSGFPGN